MTYQREAWRVQQKVSESGGSRHFRLARIVYFSDLRHSDSPIVPIGVVAEVTLDGLCGIGTALRPSLDESELNQLGPWMRDALRNPHDTLWPQMVNALTTARPGFGASGIQRAASQLTLRSLSAGP